MTSWVNAMLDAGTGSIFTKGNYATILKQQQEFSGLVDVVWSDDTTHDHSINGANFENVESI